MLHIKKGIILMVASFVPLTIYASDNCFVAKENGKIVKQIGECHKPHSPYSTFKIPIALMGFDAGILKTPEEPLLAFTEEIKKQNSPNYLPDKYPVMLMHVRSQTPSTWMKYSVIWYSQEVTKKLGMEKFKSYTDKFHYGNKDVSGTKDKNDGLAQAWLGTSLQISPLEHVEFIEKLSTNKLPISKEAQQKTAQIIFLENIGDDWQLYGKTGGGMAMGWFVGWIEKDNRRIAFAQYVEPQNSLISGGKVAKELAKDNLISIMMI